MPHDESIMLVQRWFDAVIKNDPDSLKDVFAEDYVSHHPNGEDQTGPDSMTELLDWLHMENIAVEVLKVFGNGDRVGALLRLSRNLQTAEEIQIYRILEGKIVERWIVLDGAALRHLMI